MLRNLWGTLWVVPVTRRCDGHEQGWEGASRGKGDANILRRVIIPHKRSHSMPTGRMASGPSC